MAYDDFSPPVNGRAPATPTPDSEVVKSLRGGANSFMSSMNNALGGVAQPLGFDEFAQNRFKVGHEYEQQAQEVGPSVQSLRDVHGVGDFLRFGMGQVGQMAIPAAIGVGAAMLAKSPARGLAAATAAMTPETFGHAVGEFRRTNENAPVDPETALRLGGTALASSAIQNIVPASVGASLRGAGAAANAARGFMPTMKQAVATDIGGNALAGGVADVITQRGVNPDQAVDFSRSVDAAATGGVMGVPFVGARAVAHGIHAAPRASFSGAKDLFSSAKDKTTDAVGGYMDEVSSAAQRGVEWAGGVKDATSAAFRENSPHIAEAADKVAAFVSSSAEEQIAKAKGMRDELMAAADEPAEVKQRIGKMGASLLNAADRQFVAAAKFLRDRKAKEATAPEEAAPLAVFEKLNKDLTDSADPAVDNILNDRPHDLDAEATAEGQARNDALSIEKVKEWGTSLLDTAGLTEEKRATITDALTNPESPAAQKAIALLKQGQDKASAFGSRVVDFGKSIDSYMMKHGPAKEAGVKKSEDYSGARSAIAEHIVPWLKENRPEALEGNIPALADNIRKFMVLAAEHRTDPLSPDVVHGITDLFGDDTVLLLSKVHDSLGAPDHAKAANYFRALNEIERSRRSIQSFSGFLAANAPEGSPAQKSAEALAHTLTSWATKQHAPNKGVVLDEVASQRAALENQRMDAFLETNFGEKAGAIKTALEEHVTRSRDEYAKQRTTASLLDSDNTLVDEPGRSGDGTAGAPQEEALDRVVYKKSANSKAPDAMMNPDLFASSKQPGQNYAKQALADHRAAYPDHNVKWVSGDEMAQLTGQSYPGGKDHGYIVAEKAADPERLSPQDLKRMALKNSSTKSRVEVPLKDGERMVLDAVRIKDVMLNRLPHEGGMTFAEREKAAFLAGAAELMRTYGKFDIPPDTVVSYTGGSALRFKDINKLARPQIEDRMSEGGKAALATMRKNYKDAKPSERRKILKEVQRLMWFEKTRELSNDPNDVVDRRASKRKQIEQAYELDGEQPSAYEDRSIAFDEDGALTNEGAQMLLESEGRTEPAKDGNIHRASAETKAADMVVRSNVDGTPRFTDSKVSKAEQTSRKRVLDTLSQWSELPSAPAKKLAARAEVLLANVDKMRVADREAFYQAVASRGDDAPQSPSEASAVVNDLARKYKDVITVPTKAAAEPSRPAPKEIGVEERLIKDDFSGLDTPEAVSKFLKDAYSLWENGAEDRTVQKYLNEMFDTDATFNTDVASFYDGMKGGDADLHHDEIIAKLKAESLNAEGVPPSPKAVAAKKAALTEKALSGDKALLNELSTSTDAKGLQRAAVALAEGAADSAALSAVNKRLAELVKDPDTAYGMLLTKKYSLMGVRVHEELGREGFAATHDSPIRHEGKFDWRSHKGKGEGNASFGAGTYLSTAEGVHKSYKGQFTAAVKNEYVPDEYRSAAQKNRIRVMEDISDLLGELRAMEDPKAGWDASPKEIAATKAQIAALSAQLDNGLYGNSPTYETTVNIKREELLDWNAPLSEQSELVKKALNEAGVKPEILDLGWEKERGSYEAYTEGGQYFSIAPRDGWSLSIDGEYYGTYTALDSAKRAANEWARTNVSSEDLSQATSPKDISGAEIYEQLTTRLGSQAKASDYLQSLGILGHKYDAAGGRNNVHPNYVIYDDSKITTNFVHFDKTKTGAGPKRPTDFKEAKDYLTTATPWVKTVLKNMSHAGDFERVGAEDVVRLSTHALNPTSTAFHESLHAFFAKLSDAGAHDVMGVLERAASTERVMKQMREFLKNEPEALKQLSNPEERAAYMYQMHALGELKLGPAATTVMGKIKAMIMQALGMWTNDERALHIMDYFQSGEYAKNMGSPNAVHRAMMEKGTNKIVAKAQELLEPLNDLGQAIVGVGSQRLRDTGIPALNEVANLIKATGREEHADKGILPTARDERAVRLNAISKKLEPYSNEHLADALNAMQRGEKAATAEGRIAQREVQKALADTLAYMQKAGVNISHIGAKDGVPYFPRVWDIDYISKNQSDFLNMLSKYERQGKLTGAKTLMNEMIARDGAEFGVETREPGMQFKKERLLSFIDHADAAEFMSKDLFQTLNSYITQATRRAEWTRRFGDGGEKLLALLDKAKEQGAQEKHLELTEQYLKGVDGTLGDSLNPRARRLMGDMVVYQNIRLLPLAIFSSIVDPAGLVVNGASVKEAWSTFKRGIKEIPLGFKDQTKVPKDYWTDMAETLGVIDNAVLHNSIGALYSHGMVGDTARKINDGFFRLNLMEQFNRSMRIGATEAAVKFIAKQADGGSPHSQRWLAELGLKASDIKKHEGGLAFMEEHGLSKEEAVKMRAAINQWVDGAVLRPDAADKPIWMNDPHFMLIAHLKQFMYSFHQTILKKVGHEFTHGNSGPAIALASYVPIMIAADAAKGMIQGGGGQPEFKEGWSFADYVWSGLQRAGVFGVGQMGIDVATDIHRGGFGLGAVTGPTIGQLTDVVELTGGHKQFAPVALHALPANALYGGLVKGGAKADPMFAD